METVIYLLLFGLFGVVLYLFIGTRWGLDRLAGLLRDTGLKGGG